MRGKVVVVREGGGPFQMGTFSCFVGGRLKAVWNNFRGMFADCEMVPDSQVEDDLGFYTFTA